MPFFQTPPVLGNQYVTDRVLRSYLKRALAPDVLAAIEPSLETMGELAGGRLYELQQADRRNEPTLTQWDAWGRRVDRIEVSPLWKEAARIAAEHGVVATAYERAHGAGSRVHQFALAYLFDSSTDVYTCPLAMTDGAAKTLLTHQNRELVERAVPRLLDRDPGGAWTSGPTRREQAPTRQPSAARRQVLSPAGRFARSQQPHFELARNDFEAGCAAFFSASSRCREHRARSTDTEPFGGRHSKPVLPSQKCACAASSSGTQ